MSPFWQNLELLPSASRENAREKPQRSAKEYEESREKVKEGIREASEQREHNESVADVMLYIEMNEDVLKEKMLEENLRNMLGEFSAYDKKQWGQLQQAFGEGRFDLQVKKDSNNQPHIAMQIELPEGQISEQLALTQSLQDALIAKARGKEA